MMKSASGSKTSAHHNGNHAVRFGGKFAAASDAMHSFSAESIATRDEMISAKREVSRAAVGGLIKVIPVLELQARRLRSLGFGPGHIVANLTECTKACGLVAADEMAAVEGAIGSGFKPSDAIPARPIVSVLRKEPALVMRRASEIEARSVEWLWPGRIAIGKQTLIGGEPGLSKSQVICSLAAAVSTGGLWPANTGRAPLGNVVMFNAEDDAADTLIPRLLAAGADLSRIYIVSAVTTMDGNGNTIFNLQTDLALLESKLEEIGNVYLTTFDPISSYIGGKVDTHKNAETRRLLEPLSVLAARHKTAVVAVTHSPKGQIAKAVHNFVGSIAFAAVVRAAYLIIRDPDDNERRLFLCAKNNVGKDTDGLAYRVATTLVGGEQNIVAPYVSWENEPVSITANEALGAECAGNTSTALNEAEEFLREILAVGPVAVGKAGGHGIRGQAEMNGLSWSTVKRAKKRLGISAVAIGVGGDRWHWTFPNYSRAINQENQEDHV